MQQSQARVDKRCIVSIMKSKSVVLYCSAALVDLTDHLKMSSQRGFDSDCELISNDI